MTLILISLIVSSMVREVRGLVARHRPIAPRPAPPRPAPPCPADSDQRQAIAQYAEAAARLRDVVLLIRQRIV